MKTRTVRSWKIGALVAGALAVAVTFNTIRASSEAVTANQDATAAAAPAAPEGAPIETPPAIPALTPPPVNVSPGMSQIFEMARSGVSDEVLTAFIEKSGRSYQPTAEEIIYLKDLGVSPGTISVLIRTGGDGPLNQAVTAPAKESTEVKAAGTTVNVTTENHYAAAPQSPEPAPQTAAASAPPNEVNIDYFKESLSPYGSWVYVPGIGECWRPTITVVNAGWRPYFDGGRWVYSDAGWYWLSDYSWGWAPFHYGRWHLSGGMGWVWVPGYQWGPAWVSWRTTATYCGWAPLPAYYGGTFGGSYSYYGSGWGVSVGISWGSYNWIPTRYCYGYYPRYYAAPYQVKQEIYNNSTVIKPTIIGDNNTIIINGPNATAVANASRTEIRRVSARDITNQRDPGPRTYLQNGGRELASLPATVKPTRDAGSSYGAAGNVETRRAVTRSAAPASGGSSPGEGLRSSGGDPGRATTLSSSSSTTETARNSSGTTTRNNPSTSNSRVAGQNTTINPSPAYRTPSPQSTPILRNGQTINYNVPVRHTTPVVAGAIPSETTRTTTTYRYPGSSATSYTTSRQTVRTPTVTPNTRPALQSPSAYAPTRNSAPEVRPSPKVESTQAYRPATRYTPPSTSAITIPASRPPTRSSTPTYQAPSRPSTSVPASRPTIQSQPAPTYRAPSSAPARAPSSPAPSARSSSGAPGRR